MKLLGDIAFILIIGAIGLSVVLFLSFLQAFPLILAGWVLGV